MMNPHESGFTFSFQNNLKFYHISLLTRERGYGNHKYFVEYMKNNDKLLI